MKMGGRRAFGGCRSGSGGAARAGEPLRKITKRMAAQDERAERARASCEQRHRMLRCNL